MRRTLSWTLLLLITIPWLATIAFPALHSISTIVNDSQTATTALSESAVWSVISIPKLLLATTLWGSAIALSAILLALPPAFFLAGASSPLKKRIATALTIGVLCIPPYISYWIWGLIRLPGSPLGDYLAKSSPSMHNLAGIIQLWWGLTIWAWPIPALTIANALRKIPRTRTDLLTLDAAPPFRRITVLLREARSGILLGFFLAFLAVISAAVVFDLASTSTTGLTTYTEALRRLHAEIPNNTAILFASLPFAIPMLIIALLAARIFATPPREAPHHSIPISRATTILTIIILTVAVLSPIALMLHTLGLSLQPFKELTKTDGHSLIDGLTLALGAGLVFFILTLGFSFAWNYTTRRPILKIILTIQAVSWVYASLLPGMTIGTALLQTYNHPFTNLIYHSPVIIIMGYTARFGFLPMLIARWIALNHAQTTQNLATLDGARELPDWLASVGSSPVTTAIATAFIGAFLSLGEITTTILVTPPSIQSPAERLLNRLHYAREDAAMATCLIITIIVYLGGTLAALTLTNSNQNEPTYQ